MKVNLFTQTRMLSLFAATALLASGCGQQATEPVDTTTVADAAHDDHDGHDHGGWWCNEHGIPEEECSMCSSSAANKFKEKGDWCEEHNRAESQCFECDPSRADKYAKLYEAKFGHAPPEREE